MSTMTPGSGACDIYWKIIIYLCLIFLGFIVLGFIDESLHDAQVVDGGGQWVCEQDATRQHLSYLPDVSNAAGPERGVHRPPRYCRRREQLRLVQPQAVKVVNYAGQAGAGKGMDF